MSRILLTPLIILSLSFSARAQFNKGSILLGGQLSYTYNSYSDVNPTNPFNNDQKTNTANFYISIGKAITENTVFGINLNYSPYSVSNYSYGIYSPLKYSNNSFGIGIYYRKYKNLGKDFFLFGEANALYIGSSQSGKDSTGKEVLSGTGSGGSINLFPGISYKISKKFFVEITIPDLFNVRYNSTKITSQPEVDKSDQFNITTSLSSNPLTDMAIGFRLDL